MARRFGISGLDEKAARTDNQSPTSKPAGGLSLMNNLRIGIPSKGRLADVAGELLNEAGLQLPPPGAEPVRPLPRNAGRRHLSADRRHSRAVCRRGHRHGHHRRRPGGRERRRADRAADLGVGNCRLAVCVPEDSKIESPAELDGTPRGHQLSARHRAVPAEHKAQGAPGQSVRLGRNHDRPGRGRRDRRSGGNRQHAGGQPAADSGRDRPVPDGADAEHGRADTPSWPTGSCGGWKAW